MNLNYHIHKSDIKCPYCDQEYQDDDYEVARNMEEQTELECEHCGKKFNAKTCVVYNTYADCELNKESHVLTETHIPGFFQCENCQHYGYYKTVEGVMELQ